ncbi:MAG: hypothetical protein ACM34K_16705, partial [Bacillota bacterium]
MKKVITLLFLLFFCYGSDFAQTYLGNLTNVQITETAVLVRSDSASVVFSFLSADIVRVTYAPSNSVKFDTSFTVVQKNSQWSIFTYKDLDSSFEIITSALSIVCKKYPLRISYHNSIGELLVAEPQSGGLSNMGLQRWVNFNLSPDEHLYGTGERGTSLDKRGQS